MESNHGFAGGGPRTGLNGREALLRGLLSKEGQQITKSVMMRWIERKASQLKRVGDG